jgi:hypothetical protein
LKQRPFKPYPLTPKYFDLYFWGVIFFERDGRKNLKHGGGPRFRSNASPRVPDSKFFFLSPLNNNVEIIRYCSSGGELGETRVQCR